MLTNGQSPRENPANQAVSSGAAPVKTNRPSTLCRTSAGHHRAGTANSSVPRNRLCSSHKLKPPGRAGASAEPQCQTVSSKNALTAAPGQCHQPTPAATAKPRYPSTNLSKYARCPLLTCPTAGSTNWSQAPCAKPKTSKPISSIGPSIAGTASGNTSPKQLAPPTAT
jgi:hypothetical protein